MSAIVKFVCKAAAAPGAKAKSGASWSRLSGAAEAQFVRVLRGDQLSAAPLRGRPADNRRKHKSDGFARCHRACLSCDMEVFALLVNFLPYSSLSLARRSASYSSMLRQWATFVPILVMTAPASSSGMALNPKRLHRGLHLPLCRAALLLP